MNRATAGLDRRDPSTLDWDAVADGNRFDLGDWTMRREDIIAFAEKYDPQPFHLDDAGAEGNPLFDRMSASGWHTVMAMHLMLSDFVSRTALVGLAGAGVEKIAWKTPVYPDDRLRAEMEIMIKRRSASKPRLGLLTMRIRMLRQCDDDSADEQVAEMTTTGVYSV